MSENKIDWAQARRDSKRAVSRPRDSPCPTKVSTAGRKVIIRVCDRAAILEPEIARGLAAWLTECADEIDQRNDAH
jgi:hypothetical protein